MWANSGTQISNFCLHASSRVYWMNLHPETKPGTNRLFSMYASFHSNYHTCTTFPHQSGEKFKSTLHFWQFFPFSLFLEGKTFNLYRPWLHSYLGLEWRKYHMFRLLSRIAEPKRLFQGRDLNRKKAFLSSIICSIHYIVIITFLFELKI